MHVQRSHLVRSPEKKARGACSIHQCVQSRHMASAKCFSLFQGQLKARCNARSAVCMAWPERHSAFVLKSLLGRSRGSEGAFKLKQWQVLQCLCYEEACAANDLSLCCANVPRLRLCALRSFVGPAMAWTTQRDGQIPSSGSLPGGMAEHRQQGCELGNCHFPTLDCKFVHTSLVVLLPGRQSQCGKSEE